jgi:hypothetical protein
MVVQTYMKITAQRIQLMVSNRQVQRPGIITGAEIAERPAVKIVAPELPEEHPDIELSVMCDKKAAFNIRPYFLPYVFKKGFISDFVISNAVDS